MERHDAAIRAPVKGLPRVRARRSRTETSRTAPPELRPAGTEQDAECMMLTGYIRRLREELRYAEERLGERLERLRQQPGPSECFLG